MAHEIKDGSIVFDGNCDECIEHCGAMCCKIYETIHLLAEEVISGEYDMEAHSSGDGYSYRFSLKRKINPGQVHKACVYLSEDNRCSIYDKRPFACREFTCKDRPTITYKFGPKLNTVPINKELIEVNPEAAMLAMIGDAEYYLSELREKCNSDDQKELVQVVDGILGKIDDEFINVLTSVKKT